MFLFRYFTIPVLWTSFIFIMYGISVNDVPTSDVLSFDKIAHIGLFMLNTHFWSVSLRKQFVYEKWNKNALFIAISISLVLGVFLELFQGMFFAGRTTEVLDIIANIAGAFLGLIMFRLLYGKKITFRE